MNQIKITAILYSFFEIHKILARMEEQKFDPHRYTCVVILKRSHGMGWEGMRLSKFILLRAN